MHKCCGGRNGRILVNLAVHLTWSNSAQNEILYPDNCGMRLLLCVAIDYSRAQRVNYNQKSVVHVGACSLTWLMSVSLL